MANWMMVVAMVGLWLGLGGASVAHAAVRLVDNGTSGYAIVLSKDASPSEQWAAEELVNHVREMSGATLKVQPESLAAPAKGIYLGFGAATERLGVKVDGGLGDDGFIIKTVGPNLVIAGGRRRGTMYGAYTVLEALGVQWWRRGETFIPKKRTLELPEMDVRDVPKLEYRDMMFGDSWGDDAQLWMARNKVNGMAWDDAPDKLGGRYEFVGNLVHSYMHLLERSGHEIKPEMLALVNGQRTDAQPCLTNPDTLKAMIAGVLKAFEANPNARFVVVGQEDNSSYCRCPDCAAVDAREGSNAGQVIQFANQVAEAVEKARPGSEIATAAYRWSRKPPKDLRPRDNVRIVLCSIECDFAHPLGDASNPQNKAFKDDIEGWSPIAKKLLIWNYIGSRVHYLMPNSELDTLVPNTKFFVDNKVVGVFEQGTHVGRATDFCGLKMWVLAKALWNPEADGKALISEYVNGYFGPAGPAVQRYIDIMHRTGRQQDFHLGRRVYLDAPYLKPEIIAEAEGALREADALAKSDPTYARRVRHAHMGVWYILAKRGPGSPTWRAVEAQFGKIDPEALADNLALVVRDFDIDNINDPSPVGPWMEWLADYCALASQKGVVVPPELAGADPQGYRLIQACQMDGSPSAWQRSAGASDGWAAVGGAGRRGQASIRLSPWEDCTPGRKYKVFVRARAKLQPDATGDVWRFGIGRDGPSLTVSADQLRDGAWHVFELPAWTAEEGQSFAAGRRGRGQSAEPVELDCIWLTPVQ